MKKVIFQSLIFLSAGEARLPSAVARALLAGVDTCEQMRFRVHGQRKAALSSPQAPAWLGWRARHDGALAHWLVEYPYKSI
ncbi:hypothetical protein G3480_16290 [Thiorhodococcus mannitoliphagus]|uniref:Uncharacterized protein n=1 Tax=Thiorhodococcus mannitoliphagus TaxID=329406 RepID=A0A6P1DUT5_9GAMM|nr:hypothetical protein [Thiorhodococcus mannitoliphagus]